MLEMSDQQPPADRIPIFRQDYPLIIILLAGVIISVSLVQMNASPIVEDWLLRTGAILVGPLFEGVSRPFGPLFPLIGHTLLHAGSLHLILNMVALISMGPIVALALGNSVRGSLIFIAFFAVCAIGGGLAEIFWTRLIGENVNAIGASSAISGLLPAIGFIRNGWQGAYSMSLGWVVINLILAVSGGFLALPIAWAAHLGGTAAGFSFVLFLRLANPSDPL